MTLMFPPRAAPTSAPGALSVCPASVSRASQSGACQASAGGHEPEAGLATCLPQAGSVLINRRAIMNMFVSTAAVAAAPAVAAPANSAPLAIDHRAILARVEEVVDLLRTRYVREGWKIDEERAECALAYFRRHVEGPPFKDEDEDTIEYHHAIKFLGSHGQSLDWIHDGNPGGMICGLASHSRQATASAGGPDPILEAIEAHKAARAAVASVLD